MACGRIFNFGQILHLKFTKKINVPCIHLYHDQGAGLSNT